MERAARLFRDFKICANNFENLGRVRDSRKKSPLLCLYICIEQIFTHCIIHSKWCLFRFYATQVSHSIIFTCPRMYII